MQKRRILLLNSNTTTELTQRLAARAEAFFGDRVAIVPVTAQFGPAYIASRAAYAVAAHAVISTIHDSVARADALFDACIIGCFGEPGIDAARELFQFPVIGMAEASVVSALQLGRRFAIVTVGERWPSMLSDHLKMHGYDERCCAIIDLPGDALELAKAKAEIIGPVATAIEQAVSIHRADAVIIGGAALSGIAGELQPNSPVPLIDSLDAACAQAEALGNLRPPKARVGAFAPPPPVRAIGERMSFFATTHS